MHRSYWKVRYVRYCIIGIAASFPRVLGGNKIAIPVMMKIIFIEVGSGILPSAVSQVSIILGEIPSNRLETKLATIMLSPGIGKDRN